MSYGWESYGSLDAGACGHGAVVMTGNTLRNKPGLERPSAGQIATWNRTVFEALVQEAAACSARRSFEEVLSWGSVAAWFASRKGWSGELSSQTLESALILAGQSISKPAARSGERGRPKWLHVLSEAYGTLGHTNLCRRWIQYDREVSHNIILVSQRFAAPANLVAVARDAGGECVVLDASRSMLERAAELRAYAWKNADVVLLHTHPEEVIATAAFGLAGGPPVLVVNHYDHGFWVGCSVGDLILDIRNSGHSWTRQARGVDRAVLLPLPLFDGPRRDKQGPGSGGDRQRIRKDFGVPRGSPLFLTVGGASKYDPVPELNFLEAAREILSQCPEAYLLAVGPEDHGAWKQARLATDGRLRALGWQPDSNVFCRAADVYLEGFPAGSLTALLEAAEAGLACVRAPAAVAPPFASDGPGLDEVPQPCGVKDYIEKAVALAGNLAARTEIGLKLQREVRAHHGKEGWLKRLAQIKELIPERHSVYPDFQTQPVEPHRRDWLVQYLHHNDPDLSPDSIAERTFIEAWKRTGGKPQIDEGLWRELNRNDDARGTKPVGELNAADRLALAGLNRRIRRLGMRARLVARAKLAVSLGRPKQARQLIYSCLLQRPSSLTDLQWLKVFAKSHISPKWLRGIKRLRRNQG